MNNWFLVGMEEGDTENDSQELNDNDTNGCGHDRLMTKACFVILISLKQTTKPKNR